MLSVTKELLDQRAKQFRAIQRRLLTRFKDKTPSPTQQPGYSARGNIQTGEN